MSLADGDITKYELWKRKDVMEFWGLVWELQERNKRKIKIIKGKDE